MDTLLKPGDMIRIRDDIEEGVAYRMYNDASIKNSWIKEDMISPGILVEIIDISDGQYTVQPLDKINRNSEYFEEDDFWSYTDEMFDPEMLVMLTDSMIEENYFNL